MLLGAQSRSQVIVLEGRDRVGGRMFSQTANVSGASACQPCSSPMPCHTIRMPLVCLPARLPARPPARLHACVPACPSACVPVYLRACQPACQPASLPACLPSFQVFGASKRTPLTCQAVIL